MKKNETLNKAKELQGRLVPKQQIYNHPITMNAAFRSSLSKTHTGPKSAKPTPLPPLPTIESESDGFSNLTSEEHQLRIEQLQSPLEFIDYANKFRLEKHYVYLKKGNKIENYESPTNLEIISSKDVKRDEFWTLSLKGFAHIKGSEIDFIPLNEWLKSIDQFKCLMQIKFFRIQREWRLFRLWKLCVQRDKILNARSMLSNDLFFAHRILQPSFIEIQKELFQMQSIKLYSIRPGGMYTLNQFKEENTRHQENVLNVFNTMMNKLVQIVQRACEVTLDCLNSPEKDPNDAHRSPLDQMIIHYQKIHSRAKASSQLNNQTLLSFTKKAAYKEVCQKLVRFIRLIDYLVVNNLRNICFSSLLEMFCILESLHKRGVSRIGFVDDVYMSPIQLSTEFNRYYEIIAQRTDSIFETPIFCIEVSYDSGIVFNPIERDVLKRLESVRKHFINVLINVPHLITNPLFRPYISVDLDNPDSIQDKFTMPDLAQIIHNDIVFKETTKKQYDIIGSSYRLLRKYSETFNEPIGIFETNKGFDVSFMDDRLITAVDIKKRIEEFNQQEQYLRSIVEKSEVGIYSVIMLEMKKTVLISPIRCLSMIKQQIPVVAKRYLNEFEKTIRLAYKQLTVFVDSVQSFVEYIKAVEKYSKDIKSMQTMGETIRGIFQLANEQGVYIPTDSQLDFQALLPVLESIGTSLHSSNDKKEELMPKFVGLLDKGISLLHDNVIKARTLSSNSELSSLKTLHSRAAELLVVIIAKTDELKDMAKNFNDYQISMGLPKLRFDDVHDLTKSVSYKQLLWETKSEWNSRIKFWLSNLFSMVNPDEFEKELIDFKERALKSSKGLPENPVADDLCSHINDIYNLLPVIRNLKNSALKPEHKEQIDLLLGDSLFMKDDFILQRLYDLQAYNYVEQISKISAQASNEQVLLDKLNIVRKIIEKLTFIVEPSHIQKNFYYFKGINSILDSIEDSKAIVSSIRSSKYITQLRSSTEEWIKTLRSFSSTIKKIDRCQNLWVFMSTYFASGDLARQFTNYKDMLTVDKTWKLLTTRANDDPNAFKYCQTSQVLSDLDQSLEILERIQKGIYGLLEAKRLTFPRLYFLSDKDLIGLLSKYKDPITISPYLSLLFDGLSSLEISLENHVPTVIGVYSKFGEKLNIRSVKYKSTIETWLQNIDEICTRTLKNEMKNSYQRFVELTREDWINENISQIVYVISNIHFVSSVYLAFRSGNVAFSLNVILTEIQHRISDFKSEISNITSNVTIGKYESMITAMIWYRDVLNGLLLSESPSVNNYIWENFLKFKWDESDKDIIYEIDSYVGKYGYELLGSPIKSIITPSIIKNYCYFVGSFKQHINVSLIGKASIGKSEFLYEFAHIVGYFPLFFNCGPIVSTYQVLSLLKGIVISGVWGCFVDFDRISPSVLSLLTDHFQIIRNAVSSDFKKVMFHDNEIPISPMFNIFTIHNLYTNSRSVPYSIRNHFRSIIYNSFDIARYLSLSLSLIGFSNYELLSHKIVYSLEQINIQYDNPYRYSFGIKFINIFLSDLKLSLANVSNQGNESKTISMALMKSVSRYLRKDDQNIFRGILYEQFPGIDSTINCISTSVVELMKLSINRLGLQESPGLVDKLIQIQESMKVSHGIIITGESFTGKSCMLSILEDVYNQNCIDINHPKGVQRIIVSPGSVDVQHLFGYYKKDSPIWIDGIIEDSLRQTENKSLWLVFDGTMDPYWTDSINTSLDNNRVMTFPNSSRVTVSDNTWFFFETLSLSFASPSFISRCSIITTDFHLLSVSLYAKSLIQKNINVRYNTKLSFLSKFNEISDISFISVEKFFFSYLCNYNYSTLLSCVSQFFSLFVSIYDELSDTKNDSISQMVSIYVFSFIWGFGGLLMNQHRSVFDTFIRDTFNNFVKMPHRNTVFDWCLDFENCQWVRWPDNIPTFFNSSTSENEPILELSSVISEIVSTHEVERLSYIIKKIMKINKSLLLCGPSGSGKTVLINSLFVELSNDSFGLSQIMFSKNCIGLIENALTKFFSIKNGCSLYSSSEKSGIMHIDGINSSYFNDRKPLSFLEQIREILSYGSFSSIYSGNRLTVNNINFILCVTMNNDIPDLYSQRSCREFFKLYIPHPEKQEQSRIVETYLQLFFKPFNESIRNCLRSISNALLEFYRIAENMHSSIENDTLSKYTFHDVIKVVHGIMKVTPDSLQNSSILEKIFVFETVRVFCDRIINENSKIKLMNQIESVVKKNLQNEQNMKTLLSSLFSTLSHKQQNSEDDYPTFSEFSTIKDAMIFIDEAAQDYQFTRHAMAENIVISDYTAKHILRLSRILHSYRGHAILIGNAGLGKRTVARLSSFLTKKELFEQEHTFSFRDDIKNAIIRSGVSGKRIVFLVTDIHAKLYDAYEEINRVITGFDLLSFFTSEEIDKICTDLIPLAKKKSKSEAFDDLLRFFAERVNSNLHIILSINYQEDAIKLLFGAYPSLVQNCYIDFYDDWSNSTMDYFSYCIFSSMNNDSDLSSLLASLCVYSYNVVKDIGQKMNQEIGQTFYFPSFYIIKFSYSYLALFNKKTIDNQSRIDNLSQFITKVNAIRSKVQSMQKRVSDMNSQINLFNSEISDIDKVIHKKEQIINEIRQKILLEESLIAEETQTSGDLLEKSQKEINTILPIFKGSIENLRKLSDTVFDNYTQLEYPPDFMKTIMGMICMLLDVEPSWSMGIHILRDPGFVTKLTQKFGEHRHPSPNIVSQIESAIGTMRFDQISEKPFQLLYDYLINMCQYENVYLKSIPIQQTYQQIMATLRARREKIKRKNNRLIAEKDSLDGILLSKGGSSSDHLHISETVNEYQSQINRSNDLFTSISSLIDSRMLKLEQTQNSMNSIIGDSILSIVYYLFLGQFSSEIRKTIIDNIQGFMKKNGVRFTNDFKIMDQTQNAYLIDEWIASGLPNDDTSVQNASIVANGPYFPIIVDPLGIATRWIKNFERNRNLVVLKTTTASYSRTIELSARSGTPVMVEDISDIYDPVIEALLCRRINHDGKQIAKIGDRIIEIDNAFMLYLVVSNPKPSFSMDTIQKTPIVSFTPTGKSYETRSLTGVILVENPILSNRKQELFVSYAQCKKSLIQYEEKIFEMIKNSSNTFLEDGVLINAIIEIANKANTEKVSKEALCIEINNAEAESQKYKEMAHNLTVLLESTPNISNLSPFYQFSYEKVIPIIHKLYLEDRNNINLQKEFKDFSYKVFVTICSALSNDHLLTYSFLYALNQLMDRQQINRQEMSLFRKYDSSQQYGDNPLHHIISKKSWDWFSSIAKYFPSINEYRKSIISNPKPIHDFLLGDTIRIPQYKDIRISIFQELLIIRSLCPIKLIPMMKILISEVLGDIYLYPKCITIDKYLSMKMPYPIMVILPSPNFDPTIFIYYSSIKYNLKGKLVLLTPDFSRLQYIDEQIKEAQSFGNWIILQDLHHNPSLSTDLETIILKNSQAASHEDYRLIVTSFSFSQSISFSRLFNKVSLPHRIPIKYSIFYYLSFVKDSYFDHKRWTRLIFVLAYFHSLFGLLIESSFNVSFTGIRSLWPIIIDWISAYIGDGTNDIPFSLLRDFLTNRIYSSVIIDPWDYKYTHYLIQKLFSDSMLTISYKVAHSPSYSIPLSSGKEGIYEALSTYPEIDDPKEIGIYFRTDSIKEKTLTIIATIERYYFGIEIDNQNYLMLEGVLNDVIKSLPIIDDISSHDDEDISAFSDPYTIVLKRESLFLRTRINEINESIVALIDVLKHRREPNNDHKNYFESLLLGRVPDEWRRLSSKKYLSDWVLDISHKIEFFNNWIRRGRPLSFWLAAFCEPAAFLRAVITKYARSTNIPMENLSFDIKFVEQEPTEVVDIGIMIHGLYIKGAKWNQKENDFNLKNSQKHSPCPYMWVIPTNTPNLEKTVLCPLYKTYQGPQTPQEWASCPNFVSEIRIPSQKELPGVSVLLSDE